MKYVVLFALFLVPSIAECEDTSVLSGAGATSCGEYFEKRDDYLTKAIHVSWAQGFLSGLNAAELRSGNPMKAIPDSDSIHVYVVNYCGKNPLKPVYVAAIELFGELKAHSKSQAQ